MIYLPVSQAAGTYAICSNCTDYPVWSLDGETNLTALEVFCWMKKIQPVYGKWKIITLKWNIHWLDPLDS